MQKQQQEALQCYQQHDYQWMPTVEHGLLEECLLKEQLEMPGVCCWVELSLAVLMLLCFVVSSCLCAVCERTRPANATRMVRHVLPV